MESLNFVITILVMASAIALVMGVRAKRTNQAQQLTAAMAVGDHFAPGALREIELSRPWRDRILRPAMRRAHNVGRMFTPAKNFAQIQTDLQMAGLGDKLSLADFLGLRFLAAAALCGVIFFFASVQTSFGSALSFSLTGFLLGLYLPNIWLRGRVRSRQTAVLRALPDALDMMSICVDAGLGFEAAIQRVGYQWDSELSLELRKVVSEIRVGVARIDALRHMVDRTGVADIASFVAVLVQADSLGIAIKDVLHTQSVQMRIRRRQRAEELAKKAPLKMLFPLVFFIFPAMFAVILGPAVPRLMNLF